MTAELKACTHSRSVSNLLRKSWQRGRSLLPVEGFAFGRPLVVLQSDDWGRAGVCDRAGWQELCSLGVKLGERSYDFYTLETAEDVLAVVSMLQRHRDSIGCSPCLGMNCVVANVDYTQVSASNFRKIYLRSLADGLSDGWQRPGLFDAYREGISAGMLSPALHGTTHFCQSTVERHLNDRTEKGELLRLFWNARVPYIHWRMPWVGFEYWDAERSGGEAFLNSEDQESLIDSAVKSFKRFFSKHPRSACAPGYRANDATHKAWAKHGIRVAQNGPGSWRPPHFDGNGILHLHRSLDFEPAVGQNFSLDACVRAAEHAFSRGLPAIVSVHSINFHSSIKDFRSRTLKLLDEFLSSLEKKYPDLLYLGDEDLYELIDKGRLQSAPSDVRVTVTKRKFSIGTSAAAWSA